jgi:histidine kinase
MKRITSSLWTRLLAAQLVIIGLGAITLVVLVELLAPSFFSNDIRSMNEMMTDPAHMSGMMGEVMTGTPSGFLTPDVQAGLEDSFNSSFRRALTISLGVAGIAAVGISAFATRRILLPLQAVRATTHRLAEGAYDQRIDLPGEAELAELAGDVNALAEALESIEQRRVHLISEVAHELRTPLTTLEGYLEGLLDGVFEPTDEIYAASGREVRRLKRLATDLADLSRAEEGSQPLQLESIDPADLVEEATNNLKVQAHAKEVALVVNQTGQPLRVRADRDRIGQALTNVIGNAITYTDSGGSVTVSLEVEGHQAIVEVADTGRGLTAEEQTAIFERFYRADHSVPGGSGIGLTIARAIARRHGGDITAHSPGPELGSTFTVKLPRIETTG